MKRDKQERLEAKGWRFGTAEHFLELTPDEAASVADRLKTLPQPRLPLDSTALGDSTIASRVDELLEGFGQ